MKVGILSECKRQSAGILRLPRAGKRPCRTEVIDEAENGFEITAVQLPYTLRQLETVSAGKRRAALLRACETLRLRGVPCAVYTAGMKRFFRPADAEGIRILQSGGLFYRLLPELVRRLTKKYGIDARRVRLGINSADVGEVTRYLMRELCYDVRYMRLYTSGLAAGEELSSRFSDEFGLPVEVSGQNGSYRCDILIDLDAGRLRIGRDFYIDGLELDFQTGEYEVDSMEIAAGLKGVIGPERVKFCLSGKKKLTL